MKRNVIGLSVALFTFIIGASLASLWLYKWRLPNLQKETSASAPVPPSPGASANYAKLIAGTWEGRTEFSAAIKMYLTFNDDGTAVIDYSPSGGKKFVVPYRFKDERTIIDNHHPENLIIREEEDGRIRFDPEGNSMHKDIALIYVCKFRRIK